MRLPELKHLGNTSDTRVRSKIAICQAEHIKRSSADRARAESAMRSDFERPTPFQIMECESA